MMMIKRKFAFILTILLGSIYVDASSLLDRFNSGEGRPKLRQMKRTSVVELYTGSHHARALEAQKRAYRASAIKNQRTFGGATSPRKSSPIPPYIFYQKKFDLLK
tara:strand:+ start:193 stop:507 length:315 start_codon:yes stop_codon:yes gene_type:complete